MIWRSSVLFAPDFRKGWPSVRGMPQVGSMVWRINEQVVRGEIDNRTCDRVTGRIWLAGHLLKFTNPNPQPGDSSGFSALQEAMAGDITASRKVKVPRCSAERLEACRELPWLWEKSLYLEWFKQSNGRVELGAEDEAAQRPANAEAQLRKHSP